MRILKDRLALFANQLSKEQVIANAQATNLKGGNGVGRLNHEAEPPPW